MFYNLAFHATISTWKIHRKIEMFTLQIVIYGSSIFSNFLISSLQSDSLLGLFDHIGFFEFPEPKFSNEMILGRSL